VELFAIETGKQLHSWKLDAHVMGAMFSPDSKNLYVINGKKSLFSLDKNWKNISVYDLKTKQMIAELSHDANVSTVEVSPTSEDIFVGTEKGGIYRWSSKNYKVQEKWSESGWVTDAVIDGQGRVWFGFEKGKLKVYSPNVNHLTTVRRIHKGIKKLAISNDGQVIAAATTLGSTRQLIIMKVVEKPN
jgi:WD40 repeat protein